MSITRQLLYKLSFRDILGSNGAFTASSYQLGYPNLYGGQVLAQALGSAIRQSALDLEGSDVAKQAHSLHGSFLKSGNWEDPLSYQVIPQSKGASYDRYSVNVSQRESMIFSGAVSMKRAETSAYEHFEPMADVVGWDHLENDEQIRARYKDQHVKGFPVFATQRSTEPRPIEVRPIDPVDWVEPVAKPARRWFWFRFKDADTAGPVSVGEKQQLIAYASDYGIVSVALLPHGVTWYQGGIYMASLDHAIWFYNEIDLNAWFLCDCGCPAAKDGRALIEGKIYDQRGSMVAAFTQEALLRTRRVN